MEIVEKEYEQRINDKGCQEYLKKYVAILYVYIFEMGIELMLCLQMVCTDINICADKHIC
jgi:hypothetical protein